MNWWSEDEESTNDDQERDEFRVRLRPQRGGSRPRTKIRPEHTNALVGRVISVDRGRFGVLLHEETAEEIVVSAARARELGRSAIVTGDEVYLVGDVSAAAGSLARIVRVAQRRTLLRRSADDNDAVERIIVANASQMLIVVAAANPEPRANLLDRYLVAAFDAGIKPIVCITKTDIADPTEFLSHFECLDLPIIMGSRDNFPLDDLCDLLSGQITVTVGHSGVGKSTLVNALVPEAARATGAVNQVTGRGRHTSSSTVCLRVRSADKEPGWIIDTPGIRSFGLGHVNPANILQSFANYAITAQTDSPPEVALRDAHDWEIIDRLEAGELGPSGKSRIASLQKLLSGHNGHQ